jgi:Protein of unknown function (DUF3551)
VYQPAAEEEGPRMQLIRPHALAGAMAWAALAMTVCASAPAQAQTYDPNYPVCLQIYQGMVDYYFECGFTSMAQCEASASGRSAQCVVNPYYRPHAKPGPRHKRSRKQ